MGPVERARGAAGPNRPAARERVVRHRRRGGAPRVDIEETDNACIVGAELPGVRRKDVNVEARDSEVVITGEIKEREPKGIIRRRTRRTGRFEYRVTPPRRLC